MDDPVLDRRRRDALGTGRKEPFRPAVFIDEEDPRWMQAPEEATHPGKVPEPPGEGAPDPGHQLRSQERPEIDPADDERSRDGGHAGGRLLDPRAGGDVRGPRKSGREQLARDRPGSARSGQSGPVVAVGRSAQLEHDRVERGARKRIDYWIEERIALARPVRGRDYLAVARRDEDEEPRRVGGESP